MEIINLTKTGGAYHIQTWPDRFVVPPDGHALVSDNLDRTVFYAYNGFVVLTTITEERLVGSHEEPKEVVKLVDTGSVNEDGEAVMMRVTETLYETVEDRSTVTIVTAWEPDTVAWEAWKAALPDPAPTQPTSAERIAALEHENALLNQQVAALSDQNDFQEELIVELANIVYA